MKIDDIRNQLVDELSELLSRAGRITRHLRELPPQDWEELATFRENDEVITALNDKTRLRIAEIKAALRRIGTPEWGICVSCGDAIEPARLAALPTTEYCIQCARTLDQERSGGH